MYPLFLKVRLSCGKDGGGPGGKFERDLETNQLSRKH
jgi:hypothetical protein